MEEYHSDDLLLQSLKLSVKSFTQPPLLLSSYQSFTESLSTAITVVFTIRSLLSKDYTSATHGIHTLVKSLTLTKKLNKFLILLLLSNFSSYSEQETLHWSWHITMMASLYISPQDPFYCALVCKFMELPVLLPEIIHALQTHTYEVVINQETLPEFPLSQEDYEFIIHPISLEYTYFLSELNNDSIFKTIS